jgi:hypothetical protein
MRTGFTRLAVAAGAAFTLLLAALPAMTVGAAAGGGGGGGVNSSGVTITVAPTATVAGRILATGTLTITCGPLYNYDGSVAGGSGFVVIQQPLGRSLVGAGGTYSFTCTGSPQTVTFSVAGGPFHPGTAVADGSFPPVCGATSPGGCNFECLQGDGGPTLIKLTPST